MRCMRIFLLATLMAALLMSASAIAAERKSSVTVVYTVRPSGIVSVDQLTCKIPLEGEMKDVEVSGKLTARALESKLAIEGDFKLVAKGRLRMQLQALKSMHLVVRQRGKEFTGSFRAELLEVAPVSLIDAVFSGNETYIRAEATIEGTAQDQLTLQLLMNALKQQINETMIRNKLAEYDLELEEFGMDVSAEGLKFKIALTIAVSGNLTEAIARLGGVKAEAVVTPVAMPKVEVEQASFELKYSAGTFTLTLKSTMKGDPVKLLNELKDVIIEEVLKSPETPAGLAELLERAENYKFLFKELTISVQSKADYITLDVKGLSIDMSSQRSDNLLDLTDLIRPFVHEEAADIDRSITIVLASEDDLLLKPKELSPQPTSTEDNRLVWQNPPVVSEPKLILEIKKKSIISPTVAGAAAVAAAAVAATALLIRRRPSA